MSDKRANAVGGKTARPCDSCLKSRARWFCAADDAFLCQSCDSSIHAANSLARRHERVRLKTASSSHKPNEPPCAEEVQPAWHGGFRRKARTSRPHPFAKIPKTETSSLNHHLLVPDLCEEYPEENDDQLLYRVPTFDPVLAEFCSPPGLSSPVTATVATEELKPSLPEFIPSDMDLAEFTADVESLLGRGFEEGSFCMEELGLLESRAPELEWHGVGSKGRSRSSSSSSRVKMEEEEVVGEEVVARHFENEMETLELNFDYDTPTTCEEDEEKVLVGSYVDSHVGLEKSGFSLRLDYEAVMTAWAGQGLPWTTGDRLQFNPDDIWPDYTDLCSSDLNPYGDFVAGVHVAGTGGDVGREARVLRYREKRRTRLFHKKIRYEVRKLNAEKRPRMKGRFVKRTSFAAPAFPL